MGYVEATVCDRVTQSQKQIKQNQVCSVRQIHDNTFPSWLLPEGTHCTMAGQLFASGTLRKIRYKLSSMYNVYGDYFTEIKL